MSEEPLYAESSVARHAILAVVGAQEGRLVRTGSWTGPPRGERAPRVGISSTVMAGRVGDDVINRCGLCGNAMAERRCHSTCWRINTFTLCHLVPVPLPHKEGAFSKVLRTAARKPRLHSGLDCLKCAMFILGKGLLLGPYRVTSLKEKATPLRTTVWPYA